MKDQIKKKLFDYKSLESRLPKKILKTRKRSNFGGFDDDYIKSIGGIRTGRTVILPGLTITGKKKCCTYGGNLIESMTFGVVMERFKKNPKIIERRGNRLFPTLYEDLKQLANCEFPNFKYNCITVNHNVLGKRHLDGKNVGMSMIVGFGDYQDGKICIEDKKDVSNVYKYNIRYKPLKFNGSKEYHWVDGWEGDRWTAVYFNH